MEITFAQQAEKFLSEGASRKRNPLRPASLRTYKAQIDTHLLPVLGKMKLQDVGNKIVNSLVQKMSDQGLSARTIGLNITIIKKIRKSAVDEDGNQLFPITWNSDVIDAPDMSDPKQATVSSQQITDAISKADRYQKALYAILAGTGLRIAESLAIKVGLPDDGESTVWIPNAQKIIVRQQMTRSGFGTTKTKAGQREVDLPKELNDFIASIFEQYVSISKQQGVLFAGSEDGYRHALKADGIEGGFHAFRRFRVTHLRMNGVPEALVKYWTGHAAGNITEHYTQVAGEIESRKSHAQRVGLGFQLPEIV
jgi:integrase